MKKLEETFRSLLALAGIEINGKAETDIQVLNPHLYGRVLHNGSLGLGEAYMAGWWEVDRLDEFFCKILSASVEEKVRSLRFLPHYLHAWLFNYGKRSKAFEIGKHHYDVGNMLFSKMLDKRMVYSCAYWKDAQNLDEAQEAKLDLICRKLNLKPGMKVLDIGCGWGSFCKYASEKYNIESVGITVSKEQAELAEELCIGIPVQIRFQDYRSLHATSLSGKEERFDRVVSIGMIEHVGYKNYRTFMKKVNNLLKDDGLFLLQTIGGNNSAITTDRWIAKYIFPNSMLPSIRQLASAMEGLFVMEDWHSFGPYYDRTLMAWYHNFEQAWDELKTFYEIKFFRMWKYYLLSCAGSFRARKNQLWQVVLSKNGIPGGYTSIR